MSRVVCQHCQKDFSSKRVLKHHQKTAAYCIELQTNVVETLRKQLGDSQAEVSSLRSELELARRETTRLEVLLKESMSRPTTVVHGTQQNTNKITNGIETFVHMMQPITNDHLNDQAQFLQREHIEQGAEGYARYALEYPLKDRVVCTDFARRKLQYRNNDGDLIQDPEMKKLSHELFNAIRDRNESLIQEYICELSERINEDPVLTEVMTDLLILKREVNKLSRGEKSDIGPSIIKSICGKVTSGTLSKQIDC